MKKRLLAISLLTLFPLLSGCGEDEYSVDKMTVEHSNSYQLWDNFDYSNLKVTYDGTELESKQYNVDFSKFNNGVVGTSEITISLVKSPKTSISIPVEVKNRKTCNFLAIGNSYTEDLIYYANDIIKNSDENLDIKIYGIGIGGATLDQHFDYFVHDNALYTFLQYNFEASSWEYINNMTLKGALLYEDVSWDVVTLQEQTAKSGQSNSYKHLNSFVNSISSFLKSKNKKVPSFGWHMTWAYQNGVAVDNMYYEYYGNSQETMYNAILTQTKDIVEASNLFNFILPSGTAIQNARNSELTSEKEFTRDGKHLDLKSGRYIASLDLVSKLTGYPASHFTYRGLEDSEIVSSDDQNIIYQIVDSAISNPYQITSLK